jgi:drug/metabolite transporter (DMT)-like permease
MLYNPALSPWPLPRNQAEWLALSSGIGFSLTNVLTRQARGLSLPAKSFAVWLGVLLVSLLFIPFSAAAWPSPYFFSNSQWLVMGLIAILLLAATVLVQYGVTRLPATRASVVFLFELVVAAIASYYLANESMALNEWLGGSLIVLAALFAAKSA